MSGFIAMIAHQRDQRVSEADIQPLADAYQALRGPATRHTAQAGSFARLVTFDTASAVQPGILRAGDSWAAAAGLVYGRGTLLDTPLAQLDGQFGLIRYDAEADEVVVATDPLALSALYVATRDQISYVSTSALALATFLRASPDRLALLCFLRVGLHFGALTNWQGIERLEPGTALRFSADGWRRETYWQPELDESVYRLDFQRAVDHCIEVASETYREYLTPRGPLWSDLTGGYDSRLLNLLLERADIDFHTNTTGDPQHIDVRLAGEVAAAGGWDWTSIALPQDWPQQLLRWVPTALGWSDSNIEVLRVSQVLWTHQQKSQQHTVLLSGGGHERFTGRGWLHDPINAGRPRRIELDPMIDVRLLKGTNTPIFADDPTDEIRVSLRERMAQRIAPYAEQLDTFQFDLLSTYRQMGHYGAYASAAGGVMAVQVPAFYKPVFIAAISTNPQYRSGHRLVRHMIERLNPRVAALNTQGGSPAEVMRLSNLHRFVPYYATLGRKAAMHVSRKYLRRGLLAPAPVFNDRVTAARRALLDQLSADQPFVHANLRSAPLYDPQQLDAFLRKAYEPDFTQTDLLGKVVTVELALRAVNASLAG